MEMDRWWNHDQRWFIAVNHGSKPYHSFEFDKFFGFNEYQVLQFSIFYFMHHKLWFSLAHVRLSQNWLELLTATGPIEYTTRGPYDSVLSIT